LRALPRPLLVAAALVLFLAGAYFTFGPPRFTLANAGLVLDYPWQRSAAGAAAALGAGLGAWLAQRALLRVVGTALAVLAALLAAHLLAFRVEAGPDALAARGLFGTTRIAWTAVSSVSLLPTAIEVREGEAGAITIDTGAFSPDQRASLERTVARHVREKSAGAPVVNFAR
jgi:Bacterial PH domain